MSESSDQSRPIVKPSLYEVIGAQIRTYPDRLIALHVNTDPRPVVEALTGHPQLGNESIDSKKIDGLAPFFGLAQKNEETGTENYAPIHLREENLHAGQPREGFQGLAPLEAHPEAKDRTGTVHTHPNEIPFSPFDILSLLVNKDALMMTVAPSGAINMMIKTGERIPLDKKMEAILEGAIQMLMSRFRKPLYRLSSEKVQLRVEKVVTWNLKMCRRLGIALYRGEAGQLLERIV